MQRLYRPGLQQQRGSGGDLIRVSVLFVLRGFKIVCLLMQLRSGQCHRHGQQRPTSCPRAEVSIFYLVNRNVRVACGSCRALPPPDAPLVRSNVMHALQAA